MLIWVFFSSNNIVKVTILKKVHCNDTSLCRFKLDVCTTAWKSPRSNVIFKCNFWVEYTFVTSQTFTSCWIFTSCVLGELIKNFLLAIRSPPSTYFTPAILYVSFTWNDVCFVIIPATESQGDVFEIFIAVCYSRILLVYIDNLLIFQSECILLFLDANLKGINNLRTIVEVITDEFCNDGCITSKSW